MRFSDNSLAAIIIAAANSFVVVNSGSTSSRRRTVIAETSTQLQFTEESAGDFILNHFRSSDDDPAAYNIEFRNIGASSHECLKHFTKGHELGTHNNKPLVPDSGLILSSGNPHQFISGGGDIGYGTDWFGYGDAKLTDLLQQTNPYVNTLDACKVKFEFRCVGSSNQPARLSFNYMFGSEEYYEMENSPYTDLFAFFLADENIAKLPDGETGVGITTVNSNVNNEFFIGNDVSDPLGIQYPQIEADGFTTQFTAEGSVNLNEWTRMKIVIADVGDRFIDSWVLIEGGTLSCAAANSEPTVSPSKATTLKPTTKSPTPVPTVQPTTKSPVSLLFDLVYCYYLSLKPLLLLTANILTLHIALSS